MSKTHLGTRDLSSIAIRRAPADYPRPSLNPTSPYYQPATAQQQVWLEAMVNHVPDYLYAKDLKGRFIFANAAVVANNGFGNLEAMIGLTDADIHGDETARAIEEVESAVMRSGEPDLGIAEYAMRGGPDRWLMMSRVPLRDERGDIIGVVGASKDISDQKASERLMRAQAAILQKILERVPIPELLVEIGRALRTLSEDIDVAILHRSGDGRFVIDAGANSPWLSLINALVVAGNDEVLCGIQAALRLDGTFVAEIRSAERILHGLIVVRRRPHRWNDTINEFCLAVARLVGISIDRENSERRVHLLANTDHLTGLPNRAALERRLQHMMGQMPATTFALAFIDLDNFKMINDSLGHGAGDVLLKLVAERLVATAGPDGYVARLGGDEFVLVHADWGTSEHRLREVCRAIQAPIQVDGVELHVTCSAGLSQYPRDGETIDALFSRADMAMYRAKDEGRNTVRRFLPEMAELAVSKLQRSEELRRAIAADQFVLHFQPQRHLASGMTTGVEALVRWLHPKDGLLAPSQFIGLAEETGLIAELGELVLWKACRQAKAWQDEGKAAIRMGVNVSAIQFESPHLPEMIAEVLAETKLSAQYLELEITESMVMRDNEGSIARMKELADLGISIALDDFGTGYSSLSNLKRFPISRLKIDRSFISDVTDDSDSAAITSAIIALARQMSLQTIAEGVETEAQVSFLRTAACDEAQGYHFGRPMPAHQFPHQLAHRRLAWT
jgi:diguanylate cyclase (GGDEF)-like protein/PAS domain S-box-containing protein